MSPWTIRWRIAILLLETLGEIAVVPFHILGGLLRGKAYRQRAWRFMHPPHEDAQGVGPRE